MVGVLWDGVGGGGVEISFRKVGGMKIETLDKLLISDVNILI
jgi:hypothetical protein